MIAISKLNQVSGHQNWFRGKSERTGDVWTVQAFRIGDNAEVIGTGINLEAASDDVRRAIDNFEALELV